MRLQQVTSGTATRFGYDRLDRIAEFDGSNSLLRRYVHGPGVDDPLVWYEGSGTSDRRFLSSDERGSIISVTDGSGGLLGINRYDEYGMPQPTNIGAFGYTGQAWLPSIGAYYYKARIYEPELGRFLQPDPIGYEDSPNLYAYVGNDPVNLVDPLGLTQFITVTFNRSIGSPISFGGIASTGFESVFAAMDEDPREQVRQEVLVRCDAACRQRKSPRTGGVGGSGSNAAQAAIEPSQCRTDRNISASIDAGIFLGFGGGFTIGINMDAVSGETSFFATARAGRGLGLTAGAGLGVASSPPSSGLAMTTNYALGIGSYGGSVSTGQGQPSFSGGVSAGPRVGAEYSRTQTFTRTQRLIGPLRMCS